MAIAKRQAKNKRDTRGILTGHAGTVYDVNIKYTAPSGAKKTHTKRGFPTRAEAQIYEAETRLLLLGASSALFSAQGKQLLSVYLKNWLSQYVQENLRPATYSSYQKLIERHVLPAIGGIPLNRLTPAVFDRLFAEMIARGSKPSTAQQVKRVLSVALHHACKYHYIDRNPIKDTLTRFRKSDTLPSPYTPQEMRALLRYVSESDWELPIVLGGLYGLRRCEILGLRWQNVDFEKRTIEISEQLPFQLPAATKVICEMAPPKSEKRTLPMTEATRALFLRQREWQEAQHAQAMRTGAPYYQNDLVVCAADGAPLSANSFSARFPLLLDRAGLPRMRFHDLRHSAATNMHQLTGDFFTVGEILGHTLTGTGMSLGLPIRFEAATACYVDVRTERKRQVLEIYHNACLNASDDCLCING